MLWMLRLSVSYRIMLFKLLEPHSTCCNSFVNAALAPLIEEHGAPDSLLFKGPRNMFGSLARSIVYQQLATSAADKIFGRIQEACKVL